MQDFRALKIWQQSHTLTLDVYKATAGFPDAERYGLTTQARRSASSIPANIAEGCGAGSDAEFARYLQIAMSSASELEYHLLLAHDLRLLDDVVYQALQDRVIEVKRMTASLVSRLHRPKHQSDVDLRANS